METETPTTEAEVQPRKSASLLAQEMFGSDYHGDAIEESTANITEEPAQESSDTEVEAAETEEVETEETEEEQEQPISSFSELVESLEADPEWANSLELDVKINGETGKAKIADLVASYQTQEAATKRLEEAKEKAKSITDELAQKQEQLNEKFVIAADILSEQKQSVEQELKDLESGNLSKIDPADYAAKRLKLQDKINAVDGKIAKASEAYQQTVQQNQAEMDKRHQEYVAAERNRLLEKVPEWKDPDTFKAETQQLWTYAREVGFTDEEIGNIADHRQLLILRKAMQSDSKQKASEPQKKRLRTIPKVVKPGASTGASNNSNTEIARLQKELKRTGDISIAHKIKQLKRQA